MSEILLGRRCFDCITLEGSRHSRLRSRINSMQLAPDQTRELDRYLEEYRKTESVVDNGETTHQDAFNKKRLAAIPELRQMVSDYLSGRSTLADFKEQSERLGRTHPHWGFKNFSGQMQLNQYANNVLDPERDSRFIDALTLPSSLDEAVAKINFFADYLAELKTKTDNPKSIPRVNQSFLLSYFWEIQSPEQYPVFFGSMRTVLENLGFDFKSQESAGAQYHLFVDACHTIADYFEKEKGVKETNMTWFVEHVLWNEFRREQEEVASTVAEPVKKTAAVRPIASAGADESWVPPIIADLEQLAANEETEWSKKRGVRPEKAFETKLRYVFTILGYNVTELGQGKGREPDGVAISTDGHAGYYAIVYDAKAREQSYAIGTQDREITEYIKNKQRELQRQRVDKVSFLIVSSEFTDSPSLESALKDIYRATRVPVILMRARDLLYLVSRKLSNADIDHAQLEDLFLETGVLTTDKIVDVLG